MDSGIRRLSLTIFKMSSSIKSRLLPALVAALNGIALAQLPESKIVASDAATGDNFGRSVAISGDYAIAGAPYDDDGGTNSGSAYIFKRSGTEWSQEDKIVASDPAANDVFGISVAISGDYAIVGAHNDDDGGSSSGSAYIFKRSGTEWSQEDKIVTSDPAQNDQFGMSVAISGDYAIAGAPYDDDGGGASGSAYIFKRSGTDWSQEDKIVASDPAQSDQFGTSVAIDGDYAIVGAYQDDDAGYKSNSGSAYIFKRSGTDWSQEDKIVASDAATGDNFGRSVAISGDYAIAGAYPDQSRGAAYILKKSGTDWNQNTKIIGSDIPQSAYFGWSSSIDGDYAIVGAHNDDDGGTNSGSAYIYSLKSPTFQSMALAADNSTIAVTLSEAVYSTSGGSGNLDASDFVLSISGADGWATLTSATPTSISASGNVYTLGIGLSGFANSNEVLTVTPAENAIYNAAGNPVLTNQLLNSVNLNQKTLVQVASSENVGQMYNSLLKVDDDTYALASNGQLITYTISADGSSISPVDDENLSGASAKSCRRFPSMVKASGNIYVVACSEESGYDGYIKTFNIPDDGSSITEVKSLKYATYANYNILLKMDDDTYALTYSSSASTGSIKTFTIPSDGSSITEVDSIETGTSGGTVGTTNLFKIDNNTLSDFWRHYSISSDGSIEKSYSGSSAVGSRTYSRALHIEGDIYAMVVKEKINTFSIPADGSANTPVSSYDYMLSSDNANSFAWNSYHNYPVFLKLNSNIYVVAIEDKYNYQSSKINDHLYLIKISADGQTITNIGFLEHANYADNPSNSATAYNSMVKVDANTFALAAKRSNQIKTFTANFTDDRAPTMSVIGASSDNSSVDIRFSEEVFNTNGASGDLEASDFSLSISGGIASLTSDTPTSISKIDAVTWRLGINISGGGTANGEEILTVTPASSSIYDEAGNAASSSTDSYLTDNAPPTITDATIKNDGNKTVDVTFSDKVYDTTLEFGVLEETDFVFSISGGTALLNSTTPTSISGSGKIWTLGVDVSGISDGYEVLTVNPAENAIFDRGGNAASATQSNNTTNLKADKVGTSNAVLIEANYTSYHSLVQMNVLNYALAYAGTGADGYIKTFATSADGSSITNKATIEHDNKRGYHNSLVKIDDDTYALAYQDDDEDGYIKTFTIPADGSAITEVDSLEHDTQYANHHSLVKVDDDTYALAYNGGKQSGNNTTHYGDPYIKTFNISADGSSITEVALLKHEGDLAATEDTKKIQAYYNSLLKMNDDTFLLAYYSVTLGGWGATSGTGKLKTFTISSDGLTITQVDSLEYDSDLAEYISLVKVDDDTYALAYDNGDGVVSTFSISADGSNITKVSSLVHETGIADYSSFIQMNDDNYVLAYAGTGSDGYLSTFTINSDGSSIKKVWNDEHDANNGTFNSMVKVNDDTYLLAYMGTGSSYIKSFAIASGNMSPSISSSPTVTTNEDTEHAFSVSDFNYSDPDNDNLDHIKLISTETAGTLYLDADDDDTYDSGEDVISDQQITASNITSGHLRFAPVANANGDAYATFTYKVNDGNGYSGITGTMTIKVAAVNDVPTATAQTVSADEDIDETVTLAGSDLETDTLTYIISTLPANGTLYQTSDGTVRTGGITTVPTTVTDSKNRIIYRSAVDGNGEGHGNFGFKANDGESDSPEASVVVNVVSVDDDISSIAQTISAAEDVDKTITLTASDVEGRALSYKISTLPIKGTLFQTADGTTRGDSILTVPTDLTSDSAQVIFSSALNASGDNYGNFGFRSFSGSAVSSEATVTVNVAAVNDVPIATGQIESAVEDEYELIILFGNDVEEDSLTFNISTLPANGTLFQTSDGQTTGDSILTVPTTLTDKSHRVIYISDINGNGNGHGNFGFIINDGSSESEEAIITLNVEAVNDRPTAEYFTVSGDEDVEEIITLRGSDVDGDNLSFLISTLPENGSLYQTSEDSSRGNAITTEEPSVTDDNGRVLYIAAENEGGDNYGNFGYKATDGKLESPEATVTVNIVEVDDNITVASQTVTASEDNYFPITLSATDAEGRDLTYSISSVPINGWLFQASDTSAVGDTIVIPTAVTNDSGKVIYISDLNGNGDGYGNFTFRAATGETISAEAAVTVDVLSVNDPPLVDSLSFNIVENSPIGTQLDTLSVFDIDSDLSLMRDWTIIDGDSTGHFSLNDTTGILSTNAILNFEDTPVYTISVTVTDGIDTSPAQKMFIQLTDIDEGVLIDKGGEIVTSEYGESDTFTVVLQSLPFDTVTVNLSSSDSTEAFLSLDSVVFAPELWSTPQIVTITGIEDSINDPNISYSIILDSTLSSDPNYNGLDVPDINATNMARDVYGPTVEIVATPSIVNTGSSFKVTASVTDNNAVSEALIYFALGGNTNFDELIMGLSENDQYQATIPSIAITYRGISYYIAASDTIGNNSISDLFSTNVKFAEGALSSDMEGSVLEDSPPRNKWRMISVPAKLYDDQVKTILGEALGEKTSETWMIKHWDGDSWVAPLNLLEGEGYWLIHDVDAPPSFETGSGISHDQSGYTFIFQPGWNMIGNPYPFETSFELDQSLFRGPITYGWKIEGWSQESTLRPWAGYAVYNRGDSHESVILKPVQISPTLAREKEPQPDGWKLNLTAYGKTYVDPGNAIGRLSGSLEGMDYRDNPEPPYLGGYVSLVMPRKEWNENISNFTSDIRSFDEENGIWDIELRVKKETGPVTISLDMEGDFPVEHDIVLLDLINRETHHIKETSSVTLNQNWGKLPVYPFKIIAGTPEYVSSMTQEILSQLPETFTLHQNYPNPFNPTTTIRFEIPVPSQVSLKIYNLMGQEVRTLTRDWFPMGNHQLIWNGKDQRGIPVSAGVYIYRLQSQNFQKTRKMVLLK